MISVWSELSTSKNQLATFSGLEEIRMLSLCYCLVMAGNYNLCCTLYIIWRWATASLSPGSKCSVSHKASPAKPLASNHLSFCDHFGSPANVPPTISEDLCKLKPCNQAPVLPNCHWNAELECAQMTGTNIPDHPCEPYLIQATREATSSLKSITHPQPLKA